MYHIEFGVLYVATLVYGYQYNLHQSCKEYSYRFVLLFLRLTRLPYIYHQSVLINVLGLIQRSPYLCIVFHAIHILSYLLSFSPPREVDIFSD